MIVLERHPVKILHLNVRSEMHGDEEKTAVDIKLGFDVPNSHLDSLADDLRIALFDPPTDPDMLEQGDDHLTHVRFPQLGPLPWNGKVENVRLHMHTGNGRGKGDLLFGEATFDKLLITVKEGGTCSCTVRARVLPTPDETGKLSGLLKHQVPTTVDLSNAVAGDDEDEND